MVSHRRFYLFFAGLLGILLLGLAFMAGAVSAGSKTVNSVTLTWPDDFDACEPAADLVTLSGVPAGKTARIDVFRFFPDNHSELLASTDYVTPSPEGTVAITINYPPVEQWDVVDATTGERRIVLAAFSDVANEDGTSFAKVSGQWIVTCKEEAPTPTPKPAGGEGCTPGYWRQPHHFDSWTGYSPGDDFEVVFGVDASFNPHSLQDAARLGGGGERAMARHAVAALLNAANPDVSYGFSVSDVIALVQDAYASGTFETVKDQFEAENETGCPLD